MKNLKQSMLLFAVCLNLLLVSGCSDGSRFDGLKLVDGNGDVYILKHSFMDTYFVDNISEMERNKKASPNMELNKKLESKLGK